MGPLQLGPSQSVHVRAALEQVLDVMFMKERNPMKAIRPLLQILAVITLWISALPTKAQCPFDPTVIQGSTILCPNTQMTLSTQEYDGYQWFKDGSPIPGAVQQTYTVEANTDAGSYFSVEADLDFCAELSPEVLVDGWVFLPPTVMTVADDPVGFTPDYTLYCEDASVLLIMMPPYDTNIQWTNMGTPIPGATNDTLVVTENGQYSASGAPSICPDLVQQLGVQIGIFFFVPIQPDIVPNGTELCAYPAGESYQWYFNGQPLAGSDSICIEATFPGMYVVSVDYDQSCDNDPSEPYLVTGVPVVHEAVPLTIFPLPAHDMVTVTWGDGSVISGWRIMDAMGREVQRQQGVARSPHTIDLAQLESGRYWLITPGRSAMPITVVE